MDRKDQVIAAHSVPPLPPQVRKLPVPGPVPMTRAQGGLLIALASAALVVAVVATVILSNLVGALQRVEDQLATVFAAPKWEYRIRSPDDSEWQQTMDLAGRLGWDLVAARRATGDRRTEASYEMILKRRAGARSVQDAFREAQLWEDLTRPRVDAAPPDPPPRPTRAVALLPTQRAIRAFHDEIESMKRIGFANAPLNDKAFVEWVTSRHFAHRDGWQQTLAFEIVDPAAGRYLIRSAGEDGAMKTADDEVEEFTLGSPVD